MLDPNDLARDLGNLVKKTHKDYPYISCTLMACLGALMASSDRDLARVTYGWIKEKVALSLKPRFTLEDGEHILGARPGECKDICDRMCRCGGTVHKTNIDGKVSHYCDKCHGNNPTV